ncbi:hypothetical protein IGI04_018620 [Brassica rapa subsp. trilocularis]|uniref:UDP-glycosyltransferases domain-containing protein n=1 Tax=Brassica rapa subsp. trilocularis TaxID=1813537 RepID=A0ABQ7MFX6_BRACM|nr:hypothetical protein IGI04_018620 [Brassica rapa subsp. trilocularis]
MRNTELIFIPTPTVGHLVPFLELARRLIDQDDRIRITVLVMKLQGQSHLDAYVNSIASSLPYVRFIDVPELEDKPTLGSTQSAEAFVYDFTERNIPLVRNIVLSILSSPALDGVKVKGIVADFFCLPMVEVARDVTLPFYVFFTTSSGFLAMLQYLADRHSNDTSVFVRDSGEMLSIPGFVNPVPVNVLPTALFMEDGYDAYLKLAMLFNKTNGILVNSSIDIEPFSVNHFSSEKSYPPGFLGRVKGRGMVCRWSPQVEILNHEAVGGFVSHCGWNSIVESLWFGVPTVTWPMYAEQQLNAFLMVKELNLAVELKLDYRARRDELVSASEIETAIRCVMSKDDGLVRKRVMDISQMVRRATLNGGCSTIEAIAMEKQEAELIFIPFPITGHLLATIELVKIILSHDPRRIHTITILNWGLPFLPQSNNDASLQSLAKSEPRVRIFTLPELTNPPPMEFFVRAPEAYLLEFVKRMVPLVRDAVSTLLSSSRDGSDTVRVAGFVLGMFCVPLMDVGNELHLPSYVFLTCSAGFLSLAKHIPERHRRVKSGFDRNSGEEENTVPGYVTSVPTKVLPLGLFTSESYDAWVGMAEKFHEAKGILVNSSTCLEPDAFGYFDRIPVNEYPPVYPVGPILCFNDRPILNPSERDRVMTWLDEQPESSVVFLCFGSLKNLDAAQIQEIARALEIVGCRFLWSIQTDPKEYPNPIEILPDGFMNRVSNLGFVCGWAPQVEILAHKAIGGFLSHCGWNSILESLRFGVPIATWPMYAEQQLNAFTMVKELGLALEMRLDYVLADGEIVKADEIARAVRSLMEGENVPRRKLKEIAEAAKEAMMDGGSSFVAIERFIDELIFAMDCSKSRE